MKMITKTLLIATIFISFSSCMNSSKKECNAQEKTAKDKELTENVKDTIVPKQFFELIETKETGNDTIEFITCMEYVYSPFGIIKNKQALRNSLLNNFEITDSKQEMVNGIFEFQLLKKTNSKLILFFDSEPQIKESYIFKGEIYDNTVIFDNKIKIGMSLQSFVDQFFESVPESFNEKYKVILLKSCVEGLTHTYTFEEGKLISVVFKTDSYWNVKY